MPLIVLLLSLALATPALAKVYRWVDEDGNVHYGDHVPASAAQQERQQLNERGIVVNEQNRPLSEEELAEQQAEEEAEAEAKRLAAEQERYDKFLLSTYATQDQLLVRRDDQLAILDGRIASAQKSVDQSGATLENLKKRAAGQDKVPEKLARQIAEFQSTYDKSTSALKKMKAERARVEAEFARDLARYLELTKGD